MDVLRNKPKNAKLYCVKVVRGGPQAREHDHLAMIG